jgi:hypothetical protein
MGDFFETTGEAPTAAVRASLFMGGSALATA